MRFFKKNKLYKFFFLLSCVGFGLAQPTHYPGVLFQSETTQSGQYYFYTFQKQAVVLYEINTKSEFYKIWEYDFLEEKNTETHTILYGDITGNGEKELIVVVYVFGRETELYVFKTDDNIPIGAPSIYQISSLKKGARPMQAELIGWDGDKDDEIAITISSPERRVVLLDYNINKLTPIENKIAKQFMSTTYGPIQMKILDYNQDTQDDLILYITGEEPERYIYFSKNKKEEKTKISPRGLSKFKIIQNQHGTHEMAITKMGEIYLVNQNKVLNNKNTTIDLLQFSNNLFLQISPKKIHIAELDKKMEIVQKGKHTDFPNKTPNYLYNTTQNIMVFYDSGITKAKLLLVNNNLEWQTLVTPKAPIEVLLSETESTKTPPPKKTTQNSDTLYINIGDTLEIPINQTTESNIQSVETTMLPQGMFLDPQKLSFLWGPTTQNIGEHLFQYNIIREIQPKLQINKKDSSKLALERVAQTKKEEHTHHVFVNDIPTLQINNTNDTINITGSFNTTYTIQDKMQIKNYRVDVVQPETNAMLIDGETIYWEPEQQNAGNNKFVIRVSDGFAESTNTITVFVDTTLNIEQHKIIATLNEELIYQLPHQPNYQYLLIKSPQNLRISQSGKIHWIPLATQVDENIIEIDINTGTKTDKHKLNIYVNAPPVISYRPGYKEHITQGDTFRFTCQSFDLNTSPTLNWFLAQPTKGNAFILTKTGQIEVITDSLLDNQDYRIVLSDGINEDSFLGTIYINSPPRITSSPPDYLILGDTLNYSIIVEDLNQEKPFLAQHKPSSANIITYKLLEAPLEAQIDSTGHLSWVPNQSQIGSHNFDIEIADSLTTLKHAFSLFVNDKPSIISIDSLSIIVGDTLNHFFDAADLNSESNLIYSIKTTIDELMFSGKAGKLTWVPQKEDLGLHTLEISVSDGFNLSTDTQKLKIFVYLPPTLINAPDSTAYANLQYIYSPQAHDMYKDSTYNQDIFIKFIPQDSLFTGEYNLETNTFSWIPTIQDLGPQRLEFIIKDKYNTANQEFYDINVLMSPCETLDTLYINTVDTVYLNKNTPTNQTITIKTRSPYSPFP